MAESRMLGKEEGPVRASHAFHRNGRKQDARRGAGGGHMTVKVSRGFKEKEASLLNGTAGLCRGGDPKN
jgi:hypothetical protein